jgi:hypothetical protein
MMKDNTRHRMTNKSAMSLKSSQKRMLSIQPEKSKRMSQMTPTLNQKNRSMLKTTIWEKGNCTQACLTKTASVKDMENVCGLMGLATKANGSMILLRAKAR